MLSKRDISVLRDGAVAVLYKNWRGQFTIPSSSLYPHQWNWDSAFIAIGLSHIDPQRAVDEMLTLMKAQWSNGMIPHIVFNPDVKDYKPGPQFWDCAKLRESPADIITSGITQPPVLAYAVKEISDRIEDRYAALDFLEKAYPVLKLHHDFFSRYRDPKNEGLATIVHPWESGLDNSPRWDSVLSRVKIKSQSTYVNHNNPHVQPQQRPVYDDYLRYYSLVDILKSNDYNFQEIYKKSEFAVQPILFNTLMLSSLRALSEIVTNIGEDTEEIENWINRSSQQINSKLWDNEKILYGDYDLKAENLIVIDTIANYTPIFAGIVDTEVVRIFIESLFSDRSYYPENGFPLCSVSLSQPEFDPERYWRGPVWVNMNWMIYRGLKIYDYSTEAEIIKQKTLELIFRSGFYEYFNPSSGMGLGAKDFSWTAALVLDLIES